MSKSVEVTEATDPKDEVKTNENDKQEVVAATSNEKTENSVIKPVDRNNVNNLDSSNIDNDNDDDDFGKCFWIYICWIPGDLFFWE